MNPALALDLPELDPSDLEPLDPDELPEPEAEAELIFELDLSDLELEPEEEPERVEEAPAQRLRLGEQLVAAGLIDSDMLAGALAHQRVHGGRLGSILVTMGHLRPADLETALGRQLGLDVCAVESLDPSEELLQRVPERLVRSAEVVPISLVDRHLVLGMVDPSDRSVLDHLRFALACRTIEVQLITERTFQRFLKTRYGIARPGSPHAPEDAADPGSDEASVGDMVDDLLHEALQRRASDIHLEPYQTFSRVRYRIDGQLYTVRTPSAHLHRSLVSRLKVLAGLDVASRNRPQDGHIVTRAGQGEAHFRVGTLPTSHGEKCVVRLLDRDPLLADLANLGFRPDQLDQVQRAIHSPRGLVLVTGPSGSGKTTTLHAMLTAINEPEANIVAVEDPVEAAIPGVNHVQVSERTGVSYPAALGSVLRQDPDVLLVDELVDAQVAGLAIKAAMGGRLVLSALPTGGVLASTARLVDLGIEPSLLASGLRLVLSQRLLRRLCPECAQRAPMPSHVIDRFALDPGQVETAVYREALGCPHCMGTGYRGRVAVFESLVPDRSFGELLRQGAGEAALRQAAEELGVVWLHQAAVARALAGETSFEEITRELVQGEWRAR